MPQLYFKLNQRHVFIQENGEFIAAQPTDDAGAPKDLPQTAGDFPQRTISFWMSVTVIDFLEMVQINHQKVAKEIPVGVDGLQDAAAQRKKTSCG